MRQDGFESALQKATDTADVCGITAQFRDITFRRRKKLPGELAADDPIHDPIQHMRVAFFNAVLDVALQSLEERFYTLSVIEQTYGFLLNVRQAQTSELQQSCMKFCQAHCDELDASDLCSEITALNRLLSADVTASDLHTTEDIMNYLCIGLRREGFPTLFVALQLCLTLPISVATAERSFSKLKLTKGYLRSVMNQERLSNLSIISIENDVATSIDYTTVIANFATCKARRCILK